MNQPLRRKDGAVTVEIYVTTLTPHQEDAVKTVVARLTGAFPEPLTYMGGFAGTGKSTILPFILESLGFQPERIAFVAPTGKAAKVMRQKLKAQRYPNTNATTIHSAIYRAKPAPIATLESDLAAHEEGLATLMHEIRLEHSNPDDQAGFKFSNFPKIETAKKLIQRLRAELEEVYRSNTISFQLNPDAAIQLAQLIVVDEASMVGERMANDLMQFGVPILAMGDPGQLPPIEDKPGLTKGLPDFFLTEIHRQAAENPIIRLSVLARQGKDLPNGDYGNGVVVMNRKEFDHTGSFEDRPYFIVGTNKTRWNITQMLREHFGFTRDSSLMIGPRAGEPIMIKKNSREHLNLVNGTECVALSNMELIKGEAIAIFSFEDDEGVPYRDKRVFQGKLEEHFTRRKKQYTAPGRTTSRAENNSIVLDWNYVGTAHSSQGSQWDDVILIDESGCFFQDQDKWLYTAVTRAAKRLVVLR